MVESDAMRLETKKGKTNKVPLFCWSYRAALLKLYWGSIRSQWGWRIVVAGILERN